ncbi:hypothetical protein FRC00_006773 [Tulasnella sp. 408]|nr:hypothetical protein FRC00_006773 [Tulasnella sp. 408]
MSSYYTAQPPQQPEDLNSTRNSPTTRITQWIGSLPEGAFAFRGTPSEARTILYSECPDTIASDDYKLRYWPSVSYRLGTVEQPNWVVIAYHLPAGAYGGHLNETWYVAARKSEWDALNSTTARQVILVWMRAQVDSCGPQNLSTGDLNFW